MTGEIDSCAIMDKKVHHGEVYLGNLSNRILETALGAAIVSELKCCKRCGAFTTCTTKGECCPECEWFDPIDNLCMAIPETKKAKSPKLDDKVVVESEDVDPDTFLFEDDDEDEDDSDLPPERESSGDDKSSFDDDDW